MNSGHPDSVSSRPAPAPWPLLLLLLWGAAVPPAAGQDWKTYHGSPSLDGAAPVDIAEGPVELWRLRTGEPLSGTPVGGGGVIYAVTERGKIFAVGLDGNQLWQSRAGEKQREGEEAERFTAPPLYAGDTLALGSRLGVLYAFDTTNGKERWRYEVGGPVNGTPNFLDGGEHGKPSIIVISQSDGTVHRVDLVTGRKIRTSPSTNRCDGSAALRAGTIAYGNCDAALYVISADSLEITGKIELGKDGQVFAGVALGDDAVYAGDRRGRLYAAEVRSGRILWVNEEGKGDISSTPALAEGRVVYSSDDGTVAALERSSGRTLWRISLDGRPREPVVTAGGQVIVSADGTLHLLSLIDGSTIWSREISDDITSPAVIGGLVVVGSDDGFIVAFGPPPEERVRK